MYIERLVQKVLLKAAREFPAVVLTGPRQSGKTTLLGHLFGERFHYVSLEPPDIRASALADPRAFLSVYSPPVILDEIQFAPQLLPYIKEMIDERRAKKGRFFLTGSQNLLLMERVTETLAGRAAILQLYPLSFREISGGDNDLLPWETREARVSRLDGSVLEIWQSFLRGTFPEPNAEPERDISLWYSSYLQTYLERDVRNLRQVGDLTLFQNMLRMLAARSGQLLNLTDISEDLGISLNTLKNWISVLEATFQILILRPYFINLGKRLVKMPKIYFTDVGMLCHLVGLKTAEHAAASPMAGAIFETAVIMETVKAFRNRGEDPRLYFWRTSEGQEVDLVVEVEDMLVPVEIKASATPHPLMAAGIKAFSRFYGRRAKKGYLVHLGAHRLPLSDNALAIPFGEF